MDVNKLREKLGQYIQDSDAVETFISELDEESKDIQNRNMIVREAEQEENIVEVELGDVVIQEIRAALKADFDALNQTITEQQAVIDELTTKLENIERSLQDVSKPIKEQVNEALEQTPLARSTTKIVVRPTSNKLVDEESKPVKTDGTVDVMALREQRRSKKTISNLFG